MDDTEKSNLRIDDISGCDVDTATRAINDPEGPLAFSSQAACPHHRLRSPWKRRPRARTSEFRLSVAAQRDRSGVS